MAASAPAFGGLDPAVRRRLEERGIDIERDFALFQSELRTMPPPRLLRDLGIAPVLDEQTIDRVDHLPPPRPPRHGR